MKKKIRSKRFWVFAVIILLILGWALNDLGPEGRKTLLCGFWENAKTFAILTIIMVI